MNNKFNEILFLWRESYSGKKIISFVWLLILLKYISTDEEFNSIKDIFNPALSLEIKNNIIKSFFAKKSFFDNDLVIEYFQNFFNNEIIFINYEIFKVFIEMIINFGNSELKNLFNYSFHRYNLKNLWNISWKVNTNKLISNILWEINWNVYNPICWVSKISKHLYWNFKFYWEEKNIDNLILSKINLFLNNITWQIKLWDFHDDSFYWETFEYSFSIPPFWLKDENIKWDTDYFFVNKVLNHLNEKWKWIILLPLSSVFKKSNNAIAERKRLLNLWLESIIILPKNSFNPYTSIDTVLWIFNKSKLDKYVFFIDWRNSNIEKISNAYNSKFEIENVSKFWDYQEMEKNNFNLNPWLYVNWIKEEIDILSKKEVNNFKIKNELDNNSEVQKTILEWMPKKIQELMKKWKKEWKITQEEIILALPKAEDNLDLLDEIYTKFLQLKIEIVDNLDNKKLGTCYKSIIDGVKTNNYSENKINTINIVYEKAKEKVEFENNENKAIEEEKEELKNQLKEAENKQKVNNLENITNLNDKIHVDIKNFLDYGNFKWYNFYPRFFYKIRNQDWSKQIKDSMRFSNIISLNSYIYNNDEKEKIDKQFELVKYFDTQLENEWKLEAKKEYAKKLFNILKLETILLFVVIGYLFYRYDIEGLIKIFDLLKWIFWLTLWQMTLMVWAIVKYLFPNWEKKWKKYLENI